MATINEWPLFGVLLDLTTTSGTVTRTTADEFTVVINASWKGVGSGTTYGMQVTSGGETIYIPKYDGVVRRSGSGTLTGTYSISGNGKQTKSITVTFTAYNEHASSSQSSKSTSIALDVTVPAWTSYTVTYNANGGSGAPSSQTKWKGQTLTLSSTKPTRTGYSFEGWALTKADADAGTVYYQPGGSCGKNEDLTLYAVWEANTYKITYNANGGKLTGASSQTKTYGQTLTLTGTASRTNYNFLGWSTSSSATTATYKTGSSYTNNSAVTLYAVWELAYSKPRITNLSVVRCDEDEIVTDDGTYALVQLDWACDQEISSIDIIVYSADGSEVNEYFPLMNEPQSGTSGSLRYRIGDTIVDDETDDYTGSLSADSSFIIKVIVSDAIDSYSKTVTLNGLLFPIDALVGGKGVSFGKPAEVEGYADFAYEVCLNNNLRIWGRDTNGDIREAFQPINSNGNTVIGWGNYDAKIGNTNVYGNTINLKSNDGIFVTGGDFFVDGCRVGVNNVLWSGALYMQASQTATLNAAVRSQANGVVLVWSEYDSAESAAVNANFNTCFIPKHFVSAHGGKGVGMIITSATMNIVASKYVYVSDTSITGYETNNAAAEVKDCGIKSTPKNFVLRYVIGV